MITLETTAMTVDLPGFPAAPSPMADATSPAYDARRERRR